MFIRKKKGQSILEYAILLAVIVAVIVAIQVYVKRALQGRMKASTDSIGDQFTTKDTYTIETIQQTAREEATLVGLGAGQWSRSEIDAKADGTWFKGADARYQAEAGDYTGHEITSSDYVVQDVGKKGRTHGTFDSADIGDTGLYTDD